MHNQPPSNKEIQTVWPPTARAARWSLANFPGWTLRLEKLTADHCCVSHVRPITPLPPTSHTAVYCVNRTISPSSQSHWTTLTIDLWALYAARVRANAPACRMTWIDTFHTVHWLHESGRVRFQKDWEWYKAAEAGRSLKKAVCEGTKSNNTTK